MDLERFVAKLLSGVRAIVVATVAGIATLVLVFLPSAAHATIPEYTTPVIYPYPIANDGPQSVVAIPNSGDMLIGSFGGVVQRFDPATGTFGTAIDTHHAGDYGLAITADGAYALTTSWDCSCVDIIELSTASVTTVNLPAGAGPNGVAVNAAGTTAYVASQNHNVVYVIDLTVPTYTGTSIPVGNAPFNVAMQPGGTTLAVSNISENYVSLVNTGTLAVTTVTADWTTTGLAWSTDGTNLYVTAASANSFYRFTAPSYSTDAVVTVGDSPWGIAVNSAGTLVSVANRGADSVSLLDASDFSEITTFVFDEFIELFNTAFSSDDVYLVMALHYQQGVAVSQVGTPPPAPLPDTGAWGDHALSDMRITSLAVLGLMAVGASLVMVARRRSRVTESD